MEDKKRLINECMIPYLVRAEDINCPACGNIMYIIEHISYKGRGEGGRSWRKIELACFCTTGDDISSFWSG